jgi:hypothetical protein
MHETSLITPWQESAWTSLFDNANLRISPERAFVLIQAAQSCLAIEGHWAELGVYKGSTAYLLADVLLRSGSRKRLFLFDTFSGTPAGSDRDNMKREGMYADVSLATVQDHLSEFESLLVYKAGLIPDTFEGLESETFSFLHIHLNLYQSTHDALAYLFPRLRHGGIVVIEDYGLRLCAGVKSAADEFFPRTNSRIIHLPTGQGMAFKYD